MKKLLITLALSLAMLCAFTICVFATDNEAVEYYIVQNGESELATSLKNEGKNVLNVYDLFSNAENCFFNTMADGDSVIFNLAENLTTEMSGVSNNPTVSPAIKIDKAITVTVNFLGYSWYQTSEKGYDGFVLLNADATLNLIGTKAKLEDGTVRTLGTSYSSTEYSDEIDLYSNFVAVYAGGGTLYCENLSISCLEEPIFQKDGYLAGAVTAEFVDSAFRARTNYFGINLGGKNNCNNIIKVNGGVYGTISIHNPLEGCYIKNARLLSTTGGNSLYIDSWKNRNAYTFLVENSIFDDRYWAEGDANILIFKNSTLGIIYLRGDGSGGAYAEVIDCTYDSVDFTGNKGTGQLTVINSASCEKAGSRVVVTYSNEANLETPDESYSAPALGHLIPEEAVSGVEWENFFENGAYCGICSRCQEDTKETTPSASPLFVNKGLSFAEYADTTRSMTQAYKVNREMLVYLEDGYDFGIVATINEAGAELTPALDGSGVVSASFKALGYSIFNVKVTNIPDTHNNTKIVFCAYLVNGDKTYYLNEGTTSQKIVGLDYTTVSKNN